MTKLKQCCVTYYIEGHSRSIRDYTCVRVGLCETFIQVKQKLIVSSSTSFALLITQHSRCSICHCWYIAIYWSNIIIN